MDVRSRVRGSSLLDQLTAVVVLSVGLLGLAGLEGRVQNMSANAENQTLALTLAQSQIERLRGLADIPGGAGYEKIVERNGTVNTIGGERLDTPFALRIEVARYQLQTSADADGNRYRAVGDDAPVLPDAPEFKRVKVTIAWSSKSGASRSVSLPALISRGAF